MLTTPFTAWRGIYLRPACVWCKASFLPPHPVCKPEGAGRISLTLGNTSPAPRERALQGTALYPAPPMLPLRVRLSKWGDHPSGGERRDALEKVAHSFLGGWESPRPSCRGLDRSGHLLGRFSSQGDFGCPFLCRTYKETPQLTRGRLLLGSCIHPRISLMRTSV